MTQLFPTRRSSDLLEGSDQDQFSGPGPGGLDRIPAAVGHTTGGGLAGYGRSAPFSGAGGADSLAVHAGIRRLDAMAGQLGHLLDNRGQIVRASGGDRVGQNVEIWGCAGYLKKQQNSIKDA